MAISLIRSLSATVIRNVAALKRDAKRLHKHSRAVFGTDYPLETCQRALAVSRGFKSLADVEKLTLRLGMERDAPFYTIRSRNDVHQHVLDALYRLGLDYTESAPIVFTGAQQHAIVPALTLLLEQMSFRKRPGLILIETEASAVQDTIVFEAVKRLGFEEIFEGFRSLDLRETSLPVALDTDALGWVRALTDALPHEIGQRMQDIRWTEGLARSAEEEARSRRQLFVEANARSRRQLVDTEDFAAIAFSSAKEAAYNPAHCKSWPVWTGEDAAWATCEFGRQPPTLDEQAKAVVMEIVQALDKRNFSRGTTSDRESLWRPYVVLFSRKDPASEVLAGVVHSYFYWRQANVRDRDRRSPLLYVSDGATPYAPRLLFLGDHTSVVNGLTTLPSGDGAGEFYGYKNALKVVASAEGLQYVGTRVPLM